MVIGVLACGLWLGARIRSNFPGLEVALMNLEAFLLWYVLVLIGDFLAIRCELQWWWDKLCWYVLYACPLFFLAANGIAFRRKPFWVGIGWSLILGTGASLVCLVLIRVFPLTVFGWWLFHLAIGGTE